jgi:hypothetical protein
MIKKPTYEELEQRIRELEIKLSGYKSSKHFGTNCWAEQRKFIAKGDEFDEFLIHDYRLKIY